MHQQTLKEKLEFKGIGIHSGKQALMVINPAEENTGIVFRRVDLENKPKVKALYSNVVDTRNSTAIGDGKGSVIATIEHVMSALYMAGIDNALIDIDRMEVPIMDSSAREFFAALENAEKVTQNAPRAYLKIKKEIRFEDKNGNFVELLPNPALKIDFTIEFPSKIVGRQNFSAEIEKDLFAKEIAFCRTFCEKNQVEQLQAMGLIKGGSLENAVVLDGDRILNPEGLRHERECVNHKVLDAIGDLYTSGCRVLGELKAYRTGHFHTNELLKKIFADASNYEIIQG